MSVNLLVNYPLLHSTKAVISNKVSENTLRSFETELRRGNYTEVTLMYFATHTTLSIAKLFIGRVHGENLCSNVIRYVNGATA
jgi:hypothetical protein